MASTLHSTGRMPSSAHLIERNSATISTRTTRRVVAKAAKLARMKPALAGFDRGMLVYPYRPYSIYWASVPLWGALHIQLQLGEEIRVVAGALEVADACVARLAGLGDYRFNAIDGERRRFLWPEWRSPAATRQWLTRGADGLTSGDLYARLIDTRQDTKETP